MLSIARLIKHKSMEHFRRVIVACFVVLMVLIFVIAANNYYNLSSLGNRLSEVVHKNNEKTALIYELRSTARERLILLHRIVHETDPFVIDDQVIRHQGLASKFIKLRHDLSEILTDRIEFQEMETLKDLLKIVSPAQQKVIDFVQENDNDAANKALSIAIATQENVVSQLQVFADMQEQINQKISHSTDQEIKNTFILLIIITSLVILLAGLTSWFVVRVIVAKNDELINVNKVVELTNRTLESTISNAVKANRSKSEFIANMSHELRTPMTAIRGALGMLNSGMFTNIPDDASTMIKIADTNSERLMELISDLLDFSKIEAGDLELIHREFVPRNEMEKLIIPFTKKVAQKGIELKINYDKSFPSKISTDLEHVKHIINQLLSNAIKFTDKGCVKLNMGFASNGNDMLVTIEDTGIGIHEDDTVRIFESFEQGDGSSTRKYGGTGIGLAICMKLINALEGEIGVYSEFGKGSTFWFTIPIELKQQAA